MPPAKRKGGHARLPIMGLDLGADHRTGFPASGQRAQFPGRDSNLGGADGGHVALVHQDQGVGQTFRTSSMEWLTYRMGMSKRLDRAPMKGSTSALRLASSRQRFVHQQDARAGQKSTANGDTLLFAA